MCKSEVLLLVDYTNILYRSYFSSVRDIEIIPWLPIIRYLDMLRTCAQRIQFKYDDVEIKVIFAGESMTTLNRTKLDPSYKANRVPTNDQVFIKFRKIMSQIIDDIGCHILIKDGAEGDDVIASIVRQIEQTKVCDCINQCTICQCKYDGFFQPRPYIVIFSNDRDLYSLLKHPYVEVYQSPGIFYTEEMFEKQYGFEVEDFVIFKSLVGDKSDNVPGVFGWGPARAKKFIKDGTYIKELEREGTVETFNHMKALISFNYTLEVPLEGSEMRSEFSEVVSKKVAKAYGGRALEEIALEIKKMEKSMHPEEMLYLPYGSLQMY